MKKAFFVLVLVFFFTGSSFSQAVVSETITYANLTNGFKDDVIIEKTISPKDGLNRTTVNIYKYLENDQLKLVWRGIKRLGFLSINDRTPPYEDAVELPFCLISDISMKDTDGDGVKEIEVTMKKVYYRANLSGVVDERIVHARTFRWDAADQRYE